MKRRKYRSGWEFWIAFTSYVNRNVDKWLREMGSNFFDKRIWQQKKLDEFIGVERDVE